MLVVCRGKRRGERRRDGGRKRRRTDIRVQGNALGDTDVGW